MVSGEWRMVVVRPKRADAELGETSSWQWPAVSAAPPLSVMSVTQAQHGNEHGHLAARTLHLRDGTKHFPVEPEREKLVAVQGDDPLVASAVSVVENGRAHRVLSRREVLSKLALVCIARAPAHHRPLSRAHVPVRATDAGEWMVRVQYVSAPTLEKRFSGAPARWR